MTSKHKAGAIQTTPKQKCKRREKGGDPEEMGKKKGFKRHIYKMKWEEEETQNKAGASAEEENP